MNYIALKTRGPTADYTWQLSAKNASSEHTELENLTDEKNSIAVINKELGYNVYFGGIETNQMDGRQRIIRVSVAFCGLDEHQARGLVVFAIREPDTFRIALCAAVHWESGKADMEWTADFEAVDKILEESARLNAVTQNQPVFYDAWERFYSTNYYADDEVEKEQLDRDLAKAAFELERLVHELECSSFTASVGIKLLISNAPSQGGYERAIIEADRLLWSVDNERDLSVVRSKKKVGSDPTLLPKSNEPSKTPSSSGTCPSRLSPSRDGCRLNSKKGLLIVCGVVAIGIVLVVTCKKKAPEPEDVKPATTAIPATGGKQQPADKNESPANGVEAQHAPNADQNAPVGADKLKETPEKIEPTKR